jgi:Na+/H+ antiporter NhaD/arsenite permease-like protein
VDHGAVAPAAQAAVGGASFWTATAIFVVAYAVIISEKVHKTIVALAGAALMLLLKILQQHDAFHVKDLGVDWNVIFLLASMMIVINVMRPTGVFEYLAIKSAKLGKGEPIRIMLILSVVTALASALLDDLKVNPVPYLIAEALASNIGGTATLIGDPPNIMIASRAKLDFMAFLVHLGPCVVVIMVVFLVVLKLVFGRRLHTSPELKAQVMNMNEREAIKDKRLLVKSLVVLALVLAGFTLHGALGLEPATIALGGAALLLLLSGTRSPHHVLSEIEWTTLFFFIGLFIVVGGVVKVGLISWMSERVLALTNKNMFATSMAVMWLSAILSAVIDNIPYVATMNPLIVDMAGQIWPNTENLPPDQYMTALLHHKDLLPVWWSLALGACLGGNGTAIGASANVIVVGLSERARHKISFVKFFLHGFPIMLLTVVIATLYVWLRYYVLGW